VELSGTLVSPYLEERNLDFLGYSRDVYRRTQTVPEGLITLKVTAYDYNRYPERIRVGGAQTSVWLAKSDPPLLRTPDNQQTLPAVNDLHPVIFSWLPRNAASPNSSMETTFQLELFEILLKNDNPNRVVQSQPPIYTRVMQPMQTTYSYGPADPRLTLGRTYAWRVKAVDRSERDLFANSGYSPTYTFTYGQATDDTEELAVAEPYTFRPSKPTNRRGQPQLKDNPLLPAVADVKVSTKSNTATVTWQGNPKHSYYVVEWTCKSCSKWYTADSTDQQSLQLSSLAYDREYQVRVTARSDQRKSPTTQPVHFRCTEPLVAACGEPTGEKAPPIDYNAPLLNSLSDNLEVTDKKAFRYVIKSSVQNPDGSFSGSAVMYMMLGDKSGGIPVRTAFQNIRVNQDLRVVEGTFYYVTAQSK
jgi:hypothetical protein